MPGAAHPSLRLRVQPGHNGGGMPVLERCQGLAGIAAHPGRKDAGNGGCDAGEGAGALYLGKDSLPISCVVLGVLFMQ